MRAALLLLLMGCASVTPEQARERDPFFRCYRLCDTEVAAFEVHDGRTFCRCKVHGEIPRKGGCNVASN